MTSSFINDKKINIIIQHRMDVKNKNRLNSLRPSDPYICVGNLTTIVSDNGLSPGRRQAIIWTNAGILLIGSLWTNFSEILIEIPTFSFKKMRLKVSSAKWRPFCLGLNALNHPSVCIYHLPDALLMQHFLIPRCLVSGIMIWIRYDKSGILHMFLSSPQEMHTMGTGDCR